MRYARAYYHDAVSHSGRCPADEVLKIQDGFTPEVKRLAVKLAAITAYAMAEEMLDELAEIHVSGSRIWEAVQSAGVNANSVLTQQAEQASALPDLAEISPGIAKTSTRLAATMDGVMLNIRGEGWKEAKVGCVFEFKRKDVFQDQDRNRVQAERITYVFHMGSPESFGKHVWAVAQRRNWWAAGTTAVVGDGAPWIWNLAERYFSDSTHIVDWYHAKQHLWNAARLIAPDSDAQAATWVDKLEDELFAGRTHVISSIIAIAMSAAASPASTIKLLDREARYFTDNTARMTYQAFCHHWLPIGSGTVESAAKQFKGRFTQAGMRWSRSGAVNLMPFRAAVLSRDFDALWRAACP